MPGKNKLSKVSIIIPAYNQSKLLCLAVESVLAQTYPAVEIIVIDDGSTDDTATVMEQYAGRITYIKQANQGGNIAVKTGLQVASGEYIGVLNHDDLFMPTKIERQVQVLDSRPEIGLVHCRYYHIDENGSVLDQVGILPEGNVLKELVVGNFIWSGAPLVRRECLDQVGATSAEYCGDTALWIGIARAGYQFACVQEPLGAYRILPSSQMSNIAKLEQSCIEILDKVFTDPYLPPDVEAVKERAYGGVRFWLSCRYYATHRWDDAQRNMAEALALRPQLLENPEELLRELNDNAFDLRVPDPVKFVTDVLDHLPPGAESLHQHRARILGYVYSGLALRNYGIRNVAEAQRQLSKAIAVCPAMLQHNGDFAELLFHYALRLPAADPLPYVDSVFSNLPTNAQQLAGVRTRVISDVSIGCAFQDYFAGRRRQTVNRILTGIRHRPSWLGNRGVVSILWGSLLGLLTKDLLSVRT